MNYFTSDLHFGSDEILVRENRPFKNISAFQEYCFILWNQQLTEKDTLWIIGDFINYNRKQPLSKKEIDDVFGSIKQIKAKVILILGNNELRIIQDFFDNDFQSFRDYLIHLGFYDVKKDAYLSFENESFYLNHFPSAHIEDYVNLFGHTHRATGLWKPYDLNVGCDLNYFRAYSENDILSLLYTKRKWWDNDIANLCM